MSSILFAPYRPEWLLITVVVVFLIFLFGLVGWGTILEIRYISPFTLIKTSKRDKWLRAAILASLQTAMIPLIGLMIPIISPSPNQWLFVPLGLSIWVVLLPIATVYKRWEFERHIKSYKRLDKMIKGRNNMYQRLFSTPFTSWVRILMTADQKRFFSEGFPDDIDQDRDVES